MNPNTLKNAKKIHLLGIGGSGVGAVAKILKDMGYIVSGSDDGVFPPNSIYLKKNNIGYNEGYSKDNIPKDTDLIVIGTSKKLTEGNEEVKEAHRLNIPITTFPEILSVLAENKHNIVCIGSYGKSTCTSIIAYCLEKAQKHPSFFIGAIPYNLEESSRYTDSNLFVLEGDEYPTSHSDSKSKFQYYRPNDVLLTSMSHDHINVFETQEQYSKPFISLAKTLKKDSLAVVNIDNEQTQKFISALEIKPITYAIDKDADWSAEDIKYGQNTTFFLLNKGEKVAEITTPLLGKHNVENIVGCAGVLLERGYISIDQYIDAIGTFKGVQRRLDKINTSKDIEIYEGFGSSYEKSRAAIEAILTLKPKRLIVIFEPYSLSWNHPNYVDKYKTLFTGVDKVFFYSNPSEKVKDKITQDTIYVSTTKECLEKLKGEVKKGDIVLSLSSGDLDGLIPDLVSWVDSI